MTKKVEVLIGDRKYNINVRDLHGENKIQKSLDLLNKMILKVENNYGVKDKIDSVYIACFEFAEMIFEKENYELEISKKLGDIKSILEEID